jgi:hypothetical protein
MNTKMVISPSDSNYNTHRLSEMFMEMDGFKTPTGKKWLCNYQKLERFPFSKVDEYTQEEIEIKFNKILDHFSIIVEKVENKFLEHRKEILRLKDL